MKELTWDRGIGTHSVRSNGPDRGEEEDDRHEGGPRAGPDVDEEARGAEVPGPALELVEEELAQDGDAVGPVEGDGAQVEDGRDGDVAAEPDEVDEDADERVEPDGQDGGVGAAPDLEPDARPGQHLVAREGPDGAAAGLQGRDADKVHDDEGGHGEEDGCALAHHVVVDLHNGLLDGRGEDVLRRVVRG